MSQKKGNTSNQAALALAALGIVYGDIGTSPLYAFKEAFASGMAATEMNVLASISAFLWAIMLIATLKYVCLILRFSNHGEGGVLALMALAVQSAQTHHKKLRYVMVLGMFAAGLFYADSLITPAISVLSAVEGLELVSPQFNHYIVPITIGIIIALFSIQRHGTQKLGNLLFGPMMVIWFGCLGLLGLLNLLQNPSILKALNPYYAIHFAITEPKMATTLLSAVFLALTGGEALFADMGHFGSKAVRIAWFGVVWPGLILNYLGQGALVLNDPSAIKNPFYLLAPPSIMIVFVILATIATIIASQATIAGAYSMTLQAIRLNLLPRIGIQHTSDTEQGQIYIPFINALMLFGVVLLVLGFGSSSALAAAYGLAVSGTMLITTGIVLYLLSLTRPKWFRLMSIAFVGFAIIETGFFISNVGKIAHGGWLPLSMGIVFFIILYTWQRGQKYLSQERQKHSIPMKSFIAMDKSDIKTVEGPAVYMCGDLDLVPRALMHNLKHYQVLHAQNVFLRVLGEKIPYVADQDRVRIRDLAEHMYAIELHFGFREQPLLQPVLQTIEHDHLSFDAMTTSYFASNAKLIQGNGHFNRWQFMLFNTLYRQSTSTSDYFELPPNRSVQLGAQVEL